jgi:hypothetical protein
MSLSTSSTSGRSAQVVGGADGAGRLVIVIVLARDLVALRDELRISVISSSGWMSRPSIRA